jgi:hypothetical protein
VKDDVLLVNSERVPLHLTGPRMYRRRTSLKQSNLKQPAVRLPVIDLTSTHKEIERIPDISVSSPESLPLRVQNCPGLGREENYIDDC